MVEKEWDFWRITTVVSLSIAGVLLAFLSHLSEVLFYKAVSGSASAFLLFSAALEAKMGKLTSVSDSEAKVPSSRKGALGRLPSSLGGGFRAIAEKLLFVFQTLKSSLGGLPSLGGEDSFRQKKIWFEDILDQPVPRVKKRVREQKVDLRAVLRSERRNRDREELVEWLEREYRARGG